MEKQNKIPNCFEDLPELFKEVDCGKFSFTVRMLTAEDRAVIESKTAIEYRVNPDKPSEMYFKMTEAKKTFWKVLLALGGTINGKSYKKDREGWTLKDEKGKIIPVNEETLSNPTILHPVLFDVIANTVSEMEQNYLIHKQAILKNLNPQSS